MVEPLDLEHRRIRLQGAVPVDEPQGPDRRVVEVLQPRERRANVGNGRKKIDQGAVGWQMRHDIVGILIPRVRGREGIGSGKGRVTGTRCCKRGYPGR